MVAGVASDDVLALRLALFKPVLPHNLDGSVNSLGSRVEECRSDERAIRPSSEPRREVLARRVAQRLVPGVGKLSGLLGHDRDHVGVGRSQALDGCAAAHSVKNLAAILQSECDACG